jgi:hypothetical protein
MAWREQVWNVLAFGVFPAWLAAGGADWLCHRRSGLHLLLFLEIALPLALALWLQATMAMLVLMAGAVAAHMLTSWWDTRLAQPRRHISPLEQQIHSWLEMLPLFALVLVALLHPEEFAHPRWSFELHALGPAPAVKLAVLLALAAGLALILEEWSRARRLSAAASELPASSREN